MKISYHGQPLACLCAAGLFLGWVGDVQAERQNIFVGKMSVRYDDQQRTYEKGSSVVEVSDGSGGTVIAEQVGDTTSGPAVIVVEDVTGDRERYIVAPRFTFSSIGMKDSVEFTYAPALNYDHLKETTDLDHDFRLKGKRKLTQNWDVSLNNSFFLGDDPVLQKQLSATVIVPESAAPAVETPEAESSTQTYNGTVTDERYGSRRYWRNNFDAATNYTYGEGKKLNGAYSFDVLRNDDSDDRGGYTDYDRHTGSLGIAHRFDARWTTNVGLRYTRGLFDEPDIFIVTPEDDGTDRVTPLDGVGSDDVSEYAFRLRGGYDHSARLNLFTEYYYMQTDYDASIREDYEVNNVAFGLGYDIAQHWNFTISGGPSWGSFENSPTETDYNAQAALYWRYERGTLSVFGEKGYDQSNFDGRRSGLTDFWRTGVSMNYQLTENLKANFSAAYRDNRRLQYPAPNTLIIVDTGEPIDPQGELEQIEYTEKDYDAGLSLGYSFMRWYTVSGGYRYYDHDTDVSASGTGSYYEHRFFIQLSATSQVFRW